MASRRASNSVKNSAFTEGTWSQHPIPTINTAQAANRADPAADAAEQAQTEELEDQLMHVRTSKRGEHTTTASCLAHPGPAPLSRHETTLPVLKGRTVTANKPGKHKRKDRSPPNRKLADASVAEDARSRTPDVNDPGYETATTVAYDNTPERPLAEKAKTMPPARRSSFNDNPGCIRSHAEPIAQRSQPSALGPRLAELRTRKDVPEAVKDWLALSIVTRVRNDQQRLPSHFAKVFPHLFASGTLHLASTSTTHSPTSSPPSTASYTRHPTLYCAADFGSPFSPSDQVHALAAPATHFASAGVAQRRSEEHHKGDPQAQTASKTVEQEQSHAPSSFLRSGSSTILRRP